MSYTKTWRHDVKIEFVRDVLKAMLESANHLVGGSEHIQRIVIWQALDTFDEVMKEFEEERRKKDEKT